MAAPKKILGIDKRPVAERKDHLKTHLETHFKTHLEWQLERIDISKGMVSRAHQCIVTMVQDTVWPG